jgi:hypothetical protein
MMDAIRALLATGLLVGAFAVGAHGQTVDEAVDDRAKVLDMIEVRPQLPAVNTALTFTNTWARPVKIRLEAYNHDGSSAGEVEFEVAPHGLKYFFVSRLVGAGDPRFIGWIAARTSLPISATAILLGVGTTDLPVERLPSLNSDASARRRYSLLIPLAAAF